MNSLQRAVMWAIVLALGLIVVPVYAVLVAIEDLRAWRAKH